MVDPGVHLMATNAMTEKRLTGNDIIKCFPWWKKWRLECMDSGGRRDHFDGTIINFDNMFSPLHVEDPKSDWKW